MALTVQSIYNSLSVYRLKLVAGKEGLYKYVSWVYYTEDPETIEFIRGGELAITTGLNVERYKQNTGDKSSNYIASFLSNLINAFVERNSSGLIVNVGKYIETIPPEIIELCDKLQFPLFTMSWEIHTIDIMQEVGNKIAMESLKRRTVEQCMYDAIFYKKKFDAAQLDNTSFANADEYSIILMEYPEFNFNNDEDELSRYIEFSFNSKIGLNSTDFCWFTCDKKIIYVFKTDGVAISKKIDSLARKDKYFKSSKVSVSATCRSIYELETEYHHAEIALKLCDGFYKDYNTLGFFKILAEVKNISTLESMYEDVLGKLNNFSEQKKENYIETLKSYIEANGRVQKTADENSYHRNTIKYRIHRLSEILGLDLQDGQTRYLIQTAIYIKEYLEMIK